MAYDSRLEPARVIHFPCRFNPIKPDEISPHLIILAGRTDFHFHYFPIVTEPSPFQKDNEESLRNFVPIAKEPNHPFLAYDSLVWCGQLHVERIQNIAQHVRVKPKDIKGKIDDETRKKILQKMNDKTLKLLSDEQRKRVIKYLG